MRITFLLFPGHGNTEHDWTYDYESKKYNSNIFTALRKIGTVKLVSYPWYNDILYYMYPTYRNILKPTGALGKIDVAEFCDSIWSAIKPDETVVIIAHSIGSYFAQYLACKHPDRCKFMLTINAGIIQEKKSGSKVRGPGLTDAKITKLMEKLVAASGSPANAKTVKDTAKKLMNHIYNRVITTSDKCISAVKTCSIRSVEIGKDYDLLDFEEMMMSRNPEYEAMIFYRKSTWPHYHKNIRKIMLLMIQNALA